MSLSSASPAPFALLQRLKDSFATMSVRQWTVLVFALLFAREAANGLAGLVSQLGDTDDAMRFVQIRDLMAGQAWYDLVPHRLSPPDSIPSHWSRLLDAPMVAMTWAFGLVLPADKAETLMRLVWPPLVMLPLMLIATAFAEARGGRKAAFFTLALIATALSARFQFIGGRIDHHNAMILGACGGTLLAVRGLEEKRWPLAAGALCGFGLAIGYEGLPLVLMTAGGLALAALIAEEWLDFAARFFVALAASLGLAMLATIGPSALLTIHCDALSLNMVALAAILALGFMLVATTKLRESVIGRASVLVPFGLAGLVAYGAMEPACLKGPFGQVDPALGPIWLSLVVEARPLHELVFDAPFAVIAFLLTVLPACAVQVYRAVQRKEFASDAVLALCLVALTALAFWQIKLMPYATWLALPVLGRFYASLPAMGGVRASTMQLAGLVLLSQTFVVSLGSLVPASAYPANWGVAKTKDQVDAEDKDKFCFSREALSGLSALPAGNMAGPMDMGPFILAFTPHSVLAAPYHRHGAGILANHAIMSGTPEAAKAGFEARKISYYVDCSTIGEGRNDGPPSFRARLMAGEAFPFLEPLPYQGGRVKVWRVLR